MMPPSEATMTFHELFHIVNQREDVGCPRHSTLYKFERMNKVLKRNLKNTAKGMLMTYNYNMLQLHFATINYNLQVFHLL